MLALTAGAGGGGAPAGAERLWGSGAQAPDPLYEAAVVRELDAVVAEHLVQLESLAASSQDPATAEHLRRLASQLRRVGGPPVPACACSALPLPERSHMSMHGRWWARDQAVWLVGPAEGCCLPLCWAGPIQHCACCAIGCLACLGRHRCKPTAHHSSVTPLQAAMRWRGAM